MLCMRAGLTTFRRYLASHGVRYIELLGRSGHITGQASMGLNGLLRGDWGACVTVTRCDTASADEMLDGIADPHGGRAGALYNCNHHGGRICLRQSVQKIFKCAFVP